MLSTDFATVVETYWLVTPLSENFDFENRYSIMTCIIIVMLEINVAERLSAENECRIAV
jgi:hypothetical protein